MEWQHRALPVHGALPPQGAFKPGDTAVIMVFPKRVVLSIDGSNQKICYEPGVHNVPERLACHWYLKAHGVTRHFMPDAPETLAEDSDGEGDSPQQTATAKVPGSAPKGAAKVPASAPKGSVRAGTGF